MKLEKMNDFFTARLDDYESVMMTNIGNKEGYKKMAELLPDKIVNLLDLGCGTGLELDEIFKIFPNVNVTGIDLTQSMLDKLREKHSDKNLTLINASYFDYDFGNEVYDCVVSFQTMHHFSHTDKISLYSKICNSLKKEGLYIECDYMVENQEEENFHFSENSKIRKELGILDAEIYHYDIPCTITNQINMFLKAGFKSSEKVWRVNNTTIIISKK